VRGGGAPNPFLTGIIIIVIAGIIYSVAPLKEVHVVEKLFENQTLNTGESYQFLKKQISIGDNIAPPLVKGTVKESNNRYFNFLILGSLDFELWKADREYRSYVSAKNVSSYSFTFETDYKGDYFFVVSTVDPPHARIVTLNATVEWSKLEKDRNYVLVCESLFIIGLLFAFGTLARVSLRR
jgi:hypothetical protein